LDSGLVPASQTRPLPAPFCGPNARR